MTTFTDIRQGPTMRFHPCSKPIDFSASTCYDHRGRRMFSAECFLPKGHDGPCAWVKYDMIVYPDD